MLMKVGTDTLRSQNRALILATLRKRGPVSHTEIAQWSGLSSATVSTITAELEDKNILLRLEKIPAKGRGRPRILFCQNPDCAYCIAVRITADKVEYSLVDYGGTLKDRFDFKRSNKDSTAEKFAEEFKAGLDRILQRSGVLNRDVLAISITSKGLVSRTRPVLLWSPIFGNEQINFEALLQHGWDAQISLTNETRFSAQAVAANGGRKELVHSPEDCATLSLGDSIGLGIANKNSAGQVTSFAPPFGHMLHAADGPLCRCGARGCIEAYSGFYGILRAAFDADKQIIPANFVPLAEMEKLAARARAGDRMIQYAFRQAGEVLGIGISRLHSFVGTMPITITGSGVQFFDLMRQDFEKYIKSNLQVRVGSMPKLSTVNDESKLIFQGNTQVVLDGLDATISTSQKFSKKWNKG